MKKTWCLITLILLLIGAFFILRFLLGGKEENKKPARACTMEAKLCPDGSYVGRIPPSCDFAPCPEKK